MVNKGTVVAYMAKKREVNSAYQAISAALPEGDYNYEYGPFELLVEAAGKQTAEEYTGKEYGPLAENIFSGDVSAFVQAEGYDQLATQFGVEISENEYATMLHTAAVMNLDCLRWYFGCMVEDLVARRALGI